MDYLDAHQQARLECLKLLAPVMRNATGGELLVAANVLAKFIIDGTVPASGDAA